MADDSTRVRAPANVPPWNDPDPDVGRLTDLVTLVRIGFLTQTTGRLIDTVRGPRHRSLLLTILGARDTSEAVSCLLDVSPSGVGGTDG